MSRAPGISNAVSWLRPSGGPDRSFRSVADALPASCVPEPAVDDSAVAAGRRDRSAGLPFQSGWLFRVVPWVPFCHPGVQLTIEWPAGAVKLPWAARSEEHTSELQSRPHLVC